VGRSRVTVAALDGAAHQDDALEFVEGDGSLSMAAPMFINGPMAMRVIWRVAANLVEEEGDASG